MDITYIKIKLYRFYYILLDIDKQFYLRLFIHLMCYTKVLKQKLETEEPIEEPEEILQPAPKVKKQLTQEQLDNLAKAREKARERKIELGQISTKAKALKEEKLRKDAEEINHSKSKTRTTTK